MLHSHRGSDYFSERKQGGEYIDARSHHILPSLKPLERFHLSISRILCTDQGKNVSLMDLTG